MTKLLLSLYLTNNILSSIFVLTNTIISKRIQFIYAGSIGLENVVVLLNSTSLINDLTPIEVKPLTKSESHELVLNILDSAPYSFEGGTFEYLLEKIEWYIPYFFQVLMDEIGSILLESGSQKISETDIDMAITRALKKRSYFEHWYERLRKAYKGEEFKFVKELLNIMSEKVSFLSSEIYNLAVKHKVEGTYRDLVSSLKYDGYLNNDNDPQVYRFNSNLLKEWWYRNVTK